MVGGGGMRTDKQTDARRKEKAGGPGKGHLSLSPVRRSPDLQARSTSFSKSVCKAETGQSEPEGCLWAAGKGRPGAAAMPRSGAYDAVCGRARARS